jgi:hypothetical protein
MSPTMHADLCGKFHLCWGFINHYGHLPEEWALTIFLALSLHSDQSGHLVSHAFILSMLAIYCAFHAHTEQVHSQTHFRHCEPL